MDSATLDLHLQRLNELIFDEGKIVTCMSLASELQVGLTDAKTVLETFAEDNKSKIDVTATYILCGHLKENKGLGVHLAEYTKLKECRAFYEKVSSEVIYSIQNFKQVDFNAIALSSPQAENWQGSIISKNCIKRNFVKKTLPAHTSAATTSSRPQSKPFFTTEKSKTGESSSKQNNGQRSQKDIKPKQNGGIGNFFSKMPPKASKPTEQKISSEFTNQKSESSEGTVENGISDVDMVDISKEDTKIKIENKSERTNIDASQNNKKAKLEKSEKTKSETSSSSKKRKKQSKNNESSKKRKRIQEVCDSDSDDIFENEENEDIIEMSDEEAPAPVPEVKQELPPKNKRRKAVDKTYLDDEGFMVTTTEYIYETASEDEEKPAPQAITQPKKVLTEKKLEEAPATKSKAGKGKNNQKAVTGKQPSIMSFFKKS